MLLVLEVVLGLVHPSKGVAVISTDLDPLLELHLLSTLLLFNLRSLLSSCVFFIEYDSAMLGAL